MSTFKRIALLSAWIMFSMAVQAQTIEQKLTTILSAPDSTASKIGIVHDLLQTAANNRVALRAESEKGLARLADINAQTAHFASVIAQHNDEAKENDSRMAEQNAQADRHNASRCTYDEGHPEQCASYTAEAEAIDADGRYLARVAAQLNAEKATLDAAGQGLQIEIDDFNKYKDDFNARNDANEHSIDVLMRVLSMLQKTTASCQDVLQDPKSSPERIHEACGQGSDGNGTQAPLTRSGTGGGSSNGSPR
jgi:hypothetical protein